jgi:hypothetical protein
MNLDIIRKLIQWNIELYVEYFMMDLYITYDISDYNCEFEIFIQYTFKFCFLIHICGQRHL